jgi:exodeoxyribonuclease V alpha subunit
MPQKTPRSSGSEPNRPRRKAGGSSHGLYPGGGAGGKPKFKRTLPPEPVDQFAKHVDVTITAVTYASDDGAFCILRGDDDSGNRVVLKGDLAHAHVGERLQCDGEWKHHVEHGWSFQVTDARPTEPRSIAGIAAYLEHAVPGIGPVYARAIVEKFGEDTFATIDADPSVLMTVKSSAGVRMSTSKVRAIIDKWADVRAMRNVMVFLSSHGVTSGYAGKIYRQYGEESIRILEDNPYRLVEIRGIGFKIADRIARNLNWPQESPKRIRAGLVFVLQEAESKGHVFLTEPELHEQVVEQLVLEAPDLVSSQLEELIRDKQVVLDVDDEGRRIYLPDLFFVERRLAQNVRDLVYSKAVRDVRMPERPRSGDFVPNDGQWQAIEHALTRRISLITGLPGTGKTTLVKLLVEAIDSQPKLATMSRESRVRLASPTGKAARRLTEATGRDAQTIHRLLKYSGNSNGFEHDEENPLDARFVIVDETSMVDLRLADSLLRAIGPETHLVLVGDADQLPPVGAGKVFEDLITSGRVPSVRLDEIFRQAARSLIVRNAHQVVHGRKVFRNRKQAAEELALPVEELDDDFFVVERELAEEVADTIVDFAARRIPAKYGLDPIRDVLVLAPMKAGPCGLYELNRRIQNALNPTGAKVVRDLRVGDRVIQTKNDYDIEVMNGEVGVINAYDRDSQIAELDFLDGRVKLVAAGDLDTFLPAYAISVHRAQGSQAPAVICAVSTSHFIMLTRSLVNTAITRAQKLCVCVGQGRAMNIAVRTVDARKRNSALAERLR